MLPKIKEVCHPSAHPLQASQRTQNQTQNQPASAQHEQIIVNGTMSSTPHPLLSGETMNSHQRTYSPLEPTDVRRSLTYYSCFTLVLGLQIGSGIFSAPSVVAARLSSPTFGLLVWALAGGIVWAGAASFIELGTIVPENGGIQEYLCYCYGDMFGFLFAWMWIFIVKPCSMAMVSLIFAEYLYRTILPETDMSTLILKGTAFIGIAFLTILNCMGTRFGLRTANGLMGVKVFGLGSIAVIGLASKLASFNNVAPNAGPEEVSFASSPAPILQVSQQGPSQPWQNSANLADALFAALFAYGGWESVCCSLL